MKFFKIILLIICIFTIFSLVFATNINYTQAETAIGKFNKSLNNSAKGMGYAVKGDDKHQTLPQRIGTIIQIVLTFLGVIFLLLMIYGGYIWMLARGNEQEITKAKDIIKNSIIGLIIVLAAYAITAFVGGQLISKV